MRVTAPVAKTKTAVAPVVTTSASATTPKKAATEEGPPIYVEEDSCPFEHCRFGPWKAVGAIPVYARDGVRDSPIFTLAAGEGFEALTGNVHLPKPGIYRLREPAEAYFNGEVVREIPAGETVYTLGYVGESYYHVWWKGKHYSIEIGVAEDDPAWLRPPAQEWWVKIRTIQGRIGWIDADKHEVTGSSGMEDVGAY